MKNMLEKHPITITNEEFDEGLVDIAFIAGKNTVEKLYKEFAKKRLGNELIDGIPRHEIGAVVAKMSDNEYEKRKPRIDEDLNSATPEGKITAVWEVTETSLNTDAKKERILTRFGETRFLQAMGLHSDMHILNDKGYHRALDRPYKPYVTSSGIGRSDSRGELEKASPNIANTVEPDR